MSLQKLFLTFLGTGISPKSPEILSSLLAIIIGVFVLQTLGVETLFMLTITLGMIGVFEISKYLKNEKIQAHKEIVIDKAIGTWLALMIAVSTAVTMTYPYADMLAILFSFAAYILFDTWKPSTIGWIYRKMEGGLGAILDDVISGIAGGFLTVVILTVIQKLF